MNEHTTNELKRTTLNGETICLAKDCNNTTTRLSRLCDTHQLLNLIFPEMLRLKK